MTAFWTLLFGAFLATAGGFGKFSTRAIKKEKVLKPRSRLKFARFYQLSSSVIT
jgi:hypothetical protein